MARSLKRPTQLPRDWRERLPAPLQYYREHLKGLGAPGMGGIAQAQCPFHEDDRAVLSVNLRSGHWHCPRCGDGAMPAFHQRLTDMAWSDAVSDLIKAAA